jgi:hypothetical protein
MIPLSFAPCPYHLTGLFHKFMLMNEISTEHVGWETLAETYERVMVKKARYKSVSAEEHMPKEWKIGDVKLGAEHEGENDYVDDF